MDKKIYEEKEFNIWNTKKKSIHFLDYRPFYRVGEIRWSYWGKNVKTEIHGKSERFSRPILVFKKLYGHSCLAIPLTSHVKTGDYYFTFTDVCGREFCAIFSQTRYIDGVRIREKETYVTKCEFDKIHQAFQLFLL